ncbi:hypothetical protein ACEPAI_9957 [Sanghuangporus weigelae]
MSTLDCSDLLNPTTVLAFLPPDTAKELEVSRYIYVASLGAFAWDLFSNVPLDYQLLFKSRIVPAVVVYFISRLFSLAYIVLSTIFQVGSVGNCQALLIALGVCFAIAVPATSLLFVFRIRAVFHRHKYVVWLFFFLWLAVLGGCITVPFAINGAHIGPTSNCINVGVKPFSSVGIVISAVNDLLVLVAISIKLAHNSNGGGRMENFWSGGALPQLSKAVLQSGQQYYLITVGWNVLAMVMILAPSVPPVYRAMFTIPSLAIENAMACKVYRDVKFGLIRESGGSNSEPSSQHSRGHYQHGFWRPAQGGAKPNSPHDPAGIVVSTSISSTVDPPMELDLRIPSNGRTSSTYDRNPDSKFSGLPV